MTTPWKLASVPFAFLALVGASTQARAGTSGNSDAVLHAVATAEISIVDASITLNPSQTDYDAGYVSAEGAPGIDVGIRTNSSTGAILRVLCADATPEIALADLLFKTQTAPGGVGTSISTYTAITASDQNLWTTTAATGASWTTIQTDIRVQNLFNYPDTGGGTDYTNTLTYSVVVQ